MNKKMLMFLALNSLAVIPGEAAESKTDKLYNKITKNMETGKSNNENYKLIENILKQKNKELKDLYFQGDYIIKPEYLEWQIFFSGFYNENDRGGTNGKFKEYQKEQSAKVIDLGLGIKMRELNKNITDIDITGITVPPVSSSTMNFAVPTSLAIDPINIEEFSPLMPVIPVINFNPATKINFSEIGGGAGYQTGFFPDLEGAIISEMDLTSGKIMVTSARSSLLTPAHPNYDLSTFYEYTLDNVIGAPSAGQNYSGRSVYDRITHTWSYDPVASLLTGVYTNYIIEETNPRGAGAVIGTGGPLTRIGVNGSNPDDLTIILDGDVQDARFPLTIFGYNADFPTIFDPVTHSDKAYTLDDMEGKGWITSAEKTELGSKYLDVSLGQTTANQNFQFAENNGAWYLKGSLVTGASTVTSSIGDSFNSVFTNRGTITGLNEVSSTQQIIGKQIALMHMGLNLSVKHLMLDNTGTIEMRAPQSVAYLISELAFGYYSGTSKNSNGGGSNTVITGKHVTMNNGDVKLYGNNNIGVSSSFVTQYYQPEERYLYYRLSDGYWSEATHIFYKYSTHKIVLNTPVTVLGDESIGVSIGRILSFADSKIKADVGTEDPRQNVASITGHNGLENSGNVSGGNALYTDSSSGIYINMEDNKVEEWVDIYDEIDPSKNVSTRRIVIKNPQFTLSDYLINMGSYSRGGAGVRVEEYGDVILGASSDSSTSHEINLLAGSENNVGIYTSGGNVQQ